MSTDNAREDAPVVDNTDPTHTEAYRALPHRELNKDATETMLLIHGAFDSASSWDLVAPHLSRYHLLMPDLPRHGIARNLHPFGIDTSSRLLKELIARKAHNGVAIVVGFSLGANIAADLISSYPEVIGDAAFISGYSAPPMARPPRLLPYAAWLEARIEWLIPRPLLRWLMDGADLPRPDLSICTLQLNKEILTPVKLRKWPTSWPTRTLIVAAGKGGLIPSQDSFEAARQLSGIGRKSNAATLAVMHPDMRHPWIYQAPALFAAAVEKWCIKGKILDGFIALE